jgi:ribosomal protein S18 acetylase RimI-like enzyme
MEAVISVMSMADYDESVALWKRTPGIGISAADEREPMQRFLRQNNGLCFTARMEGELAGTALCGCDGRRGYLYHLAVDERFRHLGLGKALVEGSLSALQQQGIEKCHLLVYVSNLAGQAFWQHLGWEIREDVLIMSRNIPAQPETGSGSS